MATILDFCGFETGSANSEGVTLSGTSSFGTTNVRTGTQALKVNPASGASGTCTMRAPSGVGTEYWVSVWIYIVTIPSVTRDILGFPISLGSSGAFLRINSSGQLIWVTRNLGTDTTRGTTDAVPTNTWIEVMVHMRKTATSIQEVSVYGQRFTANVDLSLVSLSTPVLGTSGTEASAMEVWYDDYSMNSTDYMPNTRVVCLYPASDNAINGWTAGNGGVTNLWDGVNNVPAAGVASASETNTTNIESATNSATDNYDANCTTYTTAGMIYRDHVEAVYAFAKHGEDAATGTKSGAVQITSNPAEGAETSFTYGNNGGAHGADPTLWQTTYTAITSAPTVTLASAPVLRVGKRTATTRTVCVEQMGVMCLYTQKPSLLAEQGSG